MANEHSQHGASRRHPPVIAPRETVTSVADKISSIVIGQRRRPGWFLGFFFLTAVLMMFLVAVGFLFVIGTGMWGIGIPVAWGFAIVSFVWWVGIGHAGTFISVILLLMHEKWRRSVNRIAEAMTIFALTCAGMFPILHLGRPWLFYWLFPYPNTMWYWPQFRSPLVWDNFAVLTYLTVSILFWYTGMLPDLATIRDRARNRVKQIFYGIIALGWRGSAVHWKRHEWAILLMAGVATPLVISVHTVVAYDFTIGIIPGWHTTILPPYFVAAAIYSGFATVLCLVIPLRKIYGLEELITDRHLDLLAKLMLTLSLIVSYSYVMEAFFSFYSADIFEKYELMMRSTGAYAPAYWSLIVFNMLMPLTLWSRRVRSNTKLLFLEALVIDAGIWTDHFVVIVVSLHQDYMPSIWRLYAPTLWDWIILWGSIGLFIMLFYIFIRFLPMISITETRQLASQMQASRK